jgi:type III secretion protein U
MSSQNTSEEKTLPPSPKKLREARRKGQIARSKEMITAAVTVAAFAYLLIFFGQLFDQLRDGLLFLPHLLDQPFPEALALLMDHFGNDFAWAVGPFITLLVVVAITTNIVINGGALVAIDPVLPKLERLDPIEGFKRIVSFKSFIELIKTTVKVAIVGAATVLIIAGSLQALAEAPACGLLCFPPMLRALIQPLILAVAGIFLITGAIDIGVQHWLFLREMRMTKSELKREQKENEGDPLIKSQHKQDRRRVAVFKTGLRNATFVIYSGDTTLAMRYALPDTAVPVLVARATQEGAPLLLKEAKSLALPTVFNVDAVARIATQLKVGQMISQNMFDSVIVCMKDAGLL